MKSATTIRRDHATKVDVRILAFFIACVLFHVAGAWSIPLIDRDEPRFAEASREMIERSDYVIPYFNDEYRFDKPPLTYWAQVASYRIFGQNDFAARFPSAVAAALTALSIFVWGTRIGSERVGWWGAIIFSLSLQTVIHAKAAVADMWLVFFVTLAHWAGYELLRDRLMPGDQISNLKHQRSFWWLFYFALAFAFLAKGPIGLVPFLTVTSTIALLRQPGLARRFKFFPGIALTVGIVCLWGIPAIVRTHGQFFYVGIGRHVIERSVSAMGGHGARSFGVYLLLLPFYFVTIFVSFFPWSTKLPWLAKRLRRNRDPLDLYLLCGSAIVFAVFTFVTTKLLHYTLPAFPLLALLLARALSAENSTRLFKKSATAMTAVCLAIALIGPSFIASLFPGRELFRRSRDYLRPEMKFAAFDYKEPSLVWYFRSRVRGWMQTTGLDRANIPRFMQKDGGRFIILPTEVATDIYPTLPDNLKQFSTDGFNVVKGKKAALTLILKPD